MTSLLEFSAIAASRGEGLHPKLRDLLERFAMLPNSEVMRYDGMLQAGPSPASESSQPLGNIISLATWTHPTGRAPAIADRRRRPIDSI